MATILIDCRLVGSGGLEKISSLLAQNICRKTHNITLLCHKQHQSLLKGLGLPLLATELPAFSVKSTLFLSREVAHWKFDFIVFPHSQFHLGKKLSQRSVYFVNDLFHLDCHDFKFQNLLKASILFLSVLLIVYFSKSIVTISEYSATRIKKTFSLFDVNLNIVYPIATAIDKRPVFNQKSKNVVSIGTIRPHKNQLVIFCLAAIYPDFIFHIIGRLGSDQKFNRIFINKLQKAQNIVWHEAIDDKKVVKLVRKAFCVIQPSKYEGFGLPVVEAQLHGVPVLCSNIDVFHEIGGESVVFFDPNNCDELILKFRDLPSKRKKLVELGYKNCIRFDQQIVRKQLAKLFGNLDGKLQGLDK